MTPEILIAIGSGVVVVNAATQIGVKIIIDRLLKNGHKNGFCSQHGELMAMVKQLAEQDKIERKEETMERAMETALKKVFNNK